MVTIYFINQLVLLVTEYIHILSVTVAGFLDLRKCDWFQIDMTLLLLSLKMNCSRVLQRMLFKVSKLHQRMP